MQITTKLRRFTLFLLSMVISSGILFAQERTVTGKVTAEGEGAIPGVNVTVQGTVIGAMTGIDGSYSVRVPGPASILVFSSVGYVTQAITVGSPDHNRCSSGIRCSGASGSGCDRLHTAKEKGPYRFRRCC